MAVACGSDEPTEPRESSSSERATSTSPSGTGRADAEDRDSSQVSGAFSDVLALIPADAEEVALLDVQTIRKNPNRFPGNFRVFEEELVEKIENELDTEEIGFDQVGYFVRFRGVEWGQETLVTGDLAFGEIRDDWEEQGKEKESYGNYEIWGSDIVVFEDEGAILTAGQREQLDRLAGAPGPLADADDENLKMILDRLGNSPATFADVDTDYGCDLDGCLGFGAAFTRFDTDRQWIHVDLVMLFSDKKMTEQAVDEYDALVEEMDDNLLGIAWELSDYIGVSEFGTTVEEIEVDGEFVLGSAIIWLREELAPPPTATPIRPTRVPTPTPAATATPLPLPQATQAIKATPFRPQATQAIEATPSRPQATPVIEATPSRPQATPQPTSRATVAPTPTPTPRATVAPTPTPTPRATAAPTAGPPMAQTSPETDREALVALYNATGGPNWNASNNWLSDAPISEWGGVSTDGNGRVTTLTLGGNQLSGEIPPELGNLVNLLLVELYDNQLSGEIPPELGNLASLQVLTLFDNQLSGEIPPELGNLANLSRLYLHNNQLSGEIPPELGNLADLQALLLAGNQLSGCVPSSLSGRLYMPRSDLGGLQFCP